MEEINRLRIMNRSKAIELNQALNMPGLKIKNLSGSQYIELLKIKRPLMKYCDEMTAEELEVCKLYNVTPDSNGIVSSKDKDFAEKIKAVQDKEFDCKVEPFLSIDEFKKFTDDVDFSIGAILAEYLLKE